LKFSQVVAGKRAERPITFEFRGVTHTALVRPLDAMEEGQALSRATAYAQEHKALEAKPGNPLFDLGLMSNIVALAYLDPESTENAREHYFDSVAQVMSLDGELLQYLHARQEIWQQECSPTKANLAGTELLNALVKLAEDETDSSFLSYRPFTQLTLMRTTAALCLSLPEARSRLISLFDPTSLKSLKTQDEKTVS
jgi:hypothetical protein